MNHTIFDEQADQILWSRNTISQWRSDRNAPRWVMRSALVLLLDDGWLRSTHHEWAALALFIMSSKGETLDAALELLHAGMDKRIAAGWICAAAENAACYQEWKKNDEVVFRTRSSHLTNRTQGICGGGSGLFA